MGCAAAARESGGARGWKSHPSNWSVHDGTARCLSARKARRGSSSPGTEPTGLNEDEPQLMGLVTVHNRSRRVPGAWTKADAGSADNRQPLSSPAGSAGTTEATVAGASDFMGGTFSAAHSDSGGDDFKPASAPKMDFCTTGLKRFPKCPPCSKTVNCSGPNVAWSQARSSSARRKSF